MATKRIRVYELARELGLTNKEALDLCLSLGIGVKSHSSSLEDQQADRARRKADREGLRRAVQPAEETPTDAPVGRAGGGRAAAGRSSAQRSAGSATSTEVPSQGPLDDAPPDLGGTSGAGPAPSRLVRSQAPGVVRAEARPAPPSGEVSTAVAPLAPPAPDVAPTTTDAAPRVPSAPVAPSPSAGTPEVSDRPGGPERDGGPGTSPTAPVRSDQTSTPPLPLRPVTPPPATSGPTALVPPGPAPRRPGSSPGAIGTTPDAVSPSPSGPAGAEPGRPVGREQRPSVAPGARPSTAPGARPPAPPGARPPAPARPEAHQGGAAGPASPDAPPAEGAPGPPRSMSGKPIPPPPGLRRPPTSMSGKPIPPPPFRARQAPSPGPGTGRPPLGGRSAPPGRGGSGFARPAPPAGGAGGFSRPGGGPPRGPGGGPGAPGGPPGGRGGFGRGRPPGQRQKRRRRRNIEELEAQEITRYTPKDSPVPEGEVVVERGATAQELGPRLNRSGADVVRFLFEQGEMITATTSLSDDMIELFAAELGATVRLVDPGEAQERELQAKYFDDDDEDDEDLRPRPPVVTVMGHVDHGKTLLLDRIRESNVVAGEAGGITQHIGAYQVTYRDQLITFIDTPGHEAFTAMRARGAEVTDIVILVVAADDGVMPQTREALAHAKAAEVPIIVAINKVDRDNADPNRVMQQLSELGLIPESWGGDTIMVEVSALQNLGVDDLLEQVLVVAELEELRANPEGRARGVVLEANLDARQGPVATVIVQSGTLRVGDSVVAGAAWGRVKALIDDRGDSVKEAPPATPVMVLNFDTVPAAGDELRVTDKGRTARDIAEQRELRSRAASQRRTSSATGTGAKLEDIFEQIQRGETATLNLVLKADMQGSLEAVSESLRKLEREEVKLSFVHRAVGGITANDVTLAAASNATIIGFNVRPDRGARELAEAQDVEVRTYEIIYKLIEDIESAMVGMLSPEFEEVITGDAEVREIFRIPRVGAVAGCYVRNGSITRGSKVRFLRDGVIIWKGSITSLRRFKEDVREVAAGFECGIGLSNNQDLREGDVIETFEEREIPRT